MTLIRSPNLMKLNNSMTITVVLGTFQVHLRAFQCVDCDFNNDLSYDNTLVTRSTTNVFDIK